MEDRFTKTDLNGRQIYHDRFQWKIDLLRQISMEDRFTKTDLNGRQIYHDRFQWKIDLLRQILI